MIVEHPPPQGGALLPSRVPIGALIALFAIAGSAPCWAGDKLWSGAAAGISLFVGVCLWSAWRALQALRQPREKGHQALIKPRLAATVATIVLGSALMLLLWLSSLVSWLAIEMALGGRTG